MNKETGQHVRRRSGDSDVLPPSGSAPALLLNPTGCYLAPLVPGGDPVSQLAESHQEGEEGGIRKEDTCLGTSTFLWRKPALLNSEEPTPTLYASSSEMNRSTASQVPRALSLCTSPGHRSHPARNPILEALEGPTAK